MVESPTWARSFVDFFLGSQAHSQSHLPDFGTPANRALHTNITMPNKHLFRSENNKNNAAFSDRKEPTYKIMTSEIHPPPPLKKNNNKKQPNLRGRKDIIGSEHTVNNI